MFADKKILALITARGGSKGIPRKNLIDLHGKPLIAWTIEAGLKSRYIDRLILSSEDSEIIATAQRFGCEVPFVRPLALATDNTPSMDVILHALDTISEEFDWLVLLQPTSPFRTAAHIDEILEFCIGMGYPMAVSVSKARKSPMHMYYKDSNGCLAPVIGYPTTTRRQDDKPVYTHNGAVYVAHSEFLKRVKSYNVPEAMGFELNNFIDIDVDEPLDIEFARFISAKKFIS